MNDKTTKMYTITHPLEAQIENRAGYSDKIVRAYGVGIMQVSDGYHTMDELYDHRFALYIALARYVVYNEVKLRGINEVVWKSKVQSDSHVMDGWFLLGIGKEAGKQITYHLPIAKWEECYFAEELEKAPTFDGHTPADVIARLATL